MYWLKQNNLIEIDGKIFQNLNNLDKLDVSVNNISIIYYDGLNRLAYLNIGHSNLRVPIFFPKMGVL